MSESSPDFVNSIYAAGKKNIESLGRAYAAEYGLSVIIVRLANVYGPGQTKEALIPSIIEQMTENISDNGRITLGNIKSVRDFVYIDDVVDGLIQLLLTSKSSGEVFNISTGIGHSVEEIVLVLSDLLHYRGSINVDSNKVRLNERQVLIANNERLKSMTGWRPQYSLKDGLTQMIGLYKKTKKLGVNHVS
jgi:UDP-glucose 4-epimerase